MSDDRSPECMTVHGSDIASLSEHVQNPMSSSDFKLGSAPERTSHSYISGLELVDCCPHHIHPFRAYLPPQVGGRCLGYPDSWPAKCHRIHNVPPELLPITMIRSLRHPIHLSACWRYAGRWDVHTRTRVATLLVDICLPRTE